MLRKRRKKSIVKRKRKVTRKTVRKTTKKRQQTRQKRHSSPISGVEFCDKCSSILIPIKSKSGSSYLKCRSCGTEKRKNIRHLRIIEKQEHIGDVTVLEKDFTLLPITEQECPKCLHKKAAWWMQQTRAADEPPTQFFRCEKCRHVWREYK